MAIGNEDNLLRRFPIGNPSYLRQDGTVTSFAFAPRSTDTDGLSVNLERLTTIQETATAGGAIGQFGVLRVKAGGVRAIHGLDCVQDAKVDNAAHSLITGHITKGKKGQLINIAERVL